MYTSKLSDLPQMEVKNTNPGIIIPEITNHEEYGAALTEFSKLMPNNPSYEQYAGKLNQYRDSLIIEKGEDPAESIDKRSREERINLAANLGRDWKKYPEAREFVRKQKGDTFVNQFEGMKESERESLRFNEAVSSMAGEGEFAMLNYCEKYGVKDLSSDGIMNHFRENVISKLDSESDAMKKGKEMAFEAMINELSGSGNGSPMGSGISFDGLTREGVYANAVFSEMHPVYESASNALSIMQKWYDNNDIIPNEKKGAGSLHDWLRYGETARYEAEQFLYKLKRDNERVYALVMAVLDKQAKEGQSKNIPFFGALGTKPIRGIKSSVLQGRKLVGVDDIDDSSLSRDRQRSLAEKDKLFSDAVAGLDERARKIIGDNLKFRWDGRNALAQISPKEKLLNDISDILNESELEALNLGLNAMDSRIQAYDDFYKGQAGIAKDLDSLGDTANSLPDGSPDWAKWMDLIGGAGGDTFSFISSAGMNTFSESVGRKFNEYRANHSANEAFWRSVPYGAAEVVSESLAYGKAGKAITWGIKKVPFAGKAVGKVEEYVKNGGVLTKGEMWLGKRAAARFGYETAVGGTMEVGEEFVTDTLAMPIDNAIAALYGSADAPSVQDWKESMRNVCSSDTFVSMYGFAALMGGLHIKGMRQDARILSMDKDALTAHGLSVEAAERISQTVGMKNRISATRMELALLDIRNEKVRRNMVEGLKNLGHVEVTPEGAIVEAMMNLGEVDRFRKNDDGSFTVTKRETGESVSMDELAASSLLTSQININSFRRAIEEQDLISMDAIVDSMKTEGAIFEAMKTPGETVEIISDLAARADILLKEGADFDSTDSSISDYIPLGAWRGIFDSMADRERIAREQGDLNDDEKGVSYSYRVRLRDGRTVVRFAEGRMSFLDILEEQIETHFSDSLEGGRSLDWYAENLRMSQKWLLENGYLDKPLVGEEGDLSRLEITEAMSRLARGVALNEGALKKMPESVRFFIKLLRSLVDKALDLAKLGKAFSVGVENGHISKDFARDVYEFAGVGAEYWGEVANKSANETIRSAGNVAGIPLFRSSFSMVSVPSDGLVNNPSEVKAKLTPLQGRVFTNKNTGIQAGIDAIISSKTKGKASASQMSVANLKRFGISEDDARKIHFTAAAHIHELFENSEDGFFEESYKGDANRAGAYHFFNSIDIEGIGSFDVNVTALAYKQKDQPNTLYTLELTIENPSDNDKSHTLSLGGSLSEAAGVSTRNLASYRSFVEKEKLTLKRKAISDGTFMKAPNGADTRLTEDQWLTVRTKAFKNWFGDWENDAANSSKVLDENGEPMVVYHGTMDEFTEFDFSRAGENYEQYGMDEGFMFFSSVESEAAYSVDSAIEAINDRKWAVADENGEEKENIDFISYEDARIMPVFLNLRNPFMEDFNEEHLGIWDRNWNDLRKKIAEGDDDYNDFDGCVFRGKDGALAMATNPNQIKSATDNRGTFDAGNPDITFSLSGGKYDINLDRLKNSRSVAKSKFWKYFDGELKRIVRESELIGYGAKDGGELIARIHANLGIVRAAVSYLPDNVKIDVRPFVSRLEMLAEMAATGRIDATGQLNEAARLELNRTANAEVDNNRNQIELVAEVTAGGNAREAGKAITKKAYREALSAEIDEIKKAWADSKANELMIDLVKSVDEKLSAYLKKEAISGIAKMIERVEAQIDSKSRKQKKGKIGAEHLRWIREKIVPLMSMSEDGLELKSNALEASIITIDDKLLGDKITEDRKAELEEEARAIQQEVLALRTYGGLENMSLDEVVFAQESLARFIDSGRAAWDAVMNSEQSRRDGIKNELKRLLPKEASKERLFNARAEGGKKHGRKGNLFARFLSLIESPLQFFSDLSGKKGMEVFAIDQQHKLSRMSAEAANRATERRERLRGLLSRVSGETKPSKINKWLLDWRKIVPDAISYSSTENEKFTIPYDKAEEIAAFPEEAAKWGYSTVQANAIVGAFEERQKENPIRQNKDGSGSVSKRKIQCEVSGSLVRKKIPLSRDIALKILMICEQEDYKKLAESNGWDEQSLGELRDFIGKDGMIIREWLIDEYKVQGDYLAAEYEKVMGVPFIRRDGYSPADFIAFDKMSSEDVERLLNGGSSRTGANAGFLKVRQKHGRDINTDKGSLMVYQQHMALTDNWVITNEWVRDMKSVLGDYHTSNKLVANIGVTDFALFKTIVNAVEQGGIRGACSLGGSDRLIRELMNTKAVGVLGFKPWSWMKQYSAVMNTLYGDPDVDAGAFMKSLAKCSFNQGKISWSEMSEQDFIKRRLMDSSDTLERATNRPLGDDMQSGDVFSKGSMIPMGTFDVGANIVGACALYDTVYTELTGRGLSHIEAIDEALRRVELSLSIGAQPMGWMEKSIFQTSSNGVGLLNFMFMSEAINKLGLVVMYAKQGKWAKAAQVYFMSGVLNQLMGMFIDYLRDDEDRSGGDDWKSYALGVLMGPVTGIPIVCEMDSLVNKALSAFGVKQKINSSGLGRAIFDTGAMFRAVKAINDEKGKYTSLDTAKAATKGAANASLITSMALACGGANSKLKAGTLALAVIGNALGWTLDVADFAGIQDAQEDAREEKNR